MLSLPLLAALGLTTLTHFRVARAQITSNATCLAQWADLYNSKGQSPCLVAAYLGGACNGGQYDVGELDSGEHYIGPSSSNANECLCSTVYYSLIEACTICQNASMITWPSWSTNCPTVFVQSFPDDIPQDSAVPAWAYDAISSNGTFDVTQALSNTSPESTATLVQSTATGPITSTSTASSSSGSSSPDNSSSSSSSSSSSKSNTGAIAGGVVGGVVGAALLGLLAFFLYRRTTLNRRQSGGLGESAGAVQPNLTGDAFVSPNKAEYAPVPYTPGAYGGGGSVGIGGGGVYADNTGLSGGGSLGAPMQQRLYDPNDPSTFPTSPSPAFVSSGGVNAQSTGASNTNTNTNSNSYAPSFPQQPQAQVQPGAYRGVAEI